MRLEAIKEGSYLYCKSAQRRGVHKVRVIEIVDYEINPDQWEEAVRYEYTYRGEYINGIQHPDQFSLTKTFRKPDCHECKLEIDEQKDIVEQCPKCEWLICPRDKACGCNR